MINPHTDGGHGDHDRTTGSQQGLWDKGYVGSSMIRPQQVNKTTASQQGTLTFFTIVDYEEIL